ncbi:hypothetical protein J4434_01490 [Candidatus Woesearchaeota archaeon]|nr:hypothetical protein [Candidatus Woesearchaeota archaeon]
MEDASGRNDDDVPAAIPTGEDEQGGVRTDNIHGIEGKVNDATEKTTDDLLAKSKKFKKERGNKPGSNPQYTPRQALEELAIADEERALVGTWLEGKDLKQLSVLQEIGYWVYKRLPSSWKNDGVKQLEDADADYQTRRDAIKWDIDFIEKRLHDESTTRGGTPSGLYKLADHYEIIMREAAESSISAYDLMGEIHAKIRENEEKLKTTPLKNKESRKDLDAEIKALRKEKKELRDNYITDKNNYTVNKNCLGSVQREIRELENKQEEMYTKLQTLDAVYTAQVQIGPSVSGDTIAAAAVKEVEADESLEQYVNLAGRANQVELKKRVIIRGMTSSTTMKPGEAPEVSDLTRPKTDDDMKYEQNLLTEMRSVANYDK